MLALILALLALPVSAARAADAETRIIVGRDPGLSGTEKAEIRDDAGVQLEQRLSLPNAEVVTAPAGQAGDALEALRANPDVRWVQVDHRRTLAAYSDSYLDKQWALTATPALDAIDAWATGADGTGVTVAIVDSGVDLTHPDLSARLSPSADWKDWVDGDSNPQDENGHGTQVAGIVAAERDNAEGIAGVAPGATIMPLRVLDANGSGYDSDIAQAFDWAGDHGAAIVNASLSGPDSAPAIADAIARHPRTLYVVAAGNDGSNNDATPQYPCDLTAANLICVGASNDTGARASFSNYGRHSVDLFAPGTSILSTYTNDGYAWGDGTSMASPQVAGVAALLVGHATGTPPAGSALADAMRASVDPDSRLASLSVAGGRIDALRAVQWTPPPAPALVPSPTPTPRPVTTVAPTPPAATPAPAPAVDTDHDGRPDATDSCPTEAAATATGCPVPELQSLKVSARHHRVSAKVRADRAAQVTVRLDRRTCKRHHHHRRCGYHRVAAKTVVGRAAHLSRQVARGRFRVTVRLTSAAGSGATRHRTLRVR